MCWYLAWVFRAPKTLFRVLALAEMVSWTLLILGLIVKYAFSLDIAAVIGGSIHGFVFLSYGATAVLLTFHQRWPVWLGVVTVLSAIVPYATLPVERWLARTGRLEGQWKLEVPPAAERRWYDPIMVWFLRHPLLFGVLIVLAVIALYFVFLWIGPPIPKS